MIKVKDGYAKLIGTTYKGSADRVLLSNGGDKVIGNASGNIPISNGTVNTNLNADLLDGKHADSFIKVKLVSVEQNTDPYTWIKEYALTNGNLKSRVYNSYGVEWAYLINMNDNKTYGTILRTSYGYNHIPRMLLMGLTKGVWSEWNTILHSGNYSSYLGYIGTTPVQASSAALALTGITTATLSSTLSVGGKISLTGTTADTSHILFNRTNYNYITFPDGYSLAFGTATDSARTMFRMDKNAFFPERNNEKILGTSNARWSNIYSVLGNFSGEISVKDQRFNYGLAYYNRTNSALTGTIVITLPNGWNGSMNTYEIDIYEFNWYSETENNILHSKIIVSGYNYTNDECWLNYGYQQIGSYNKGVRLGYDGTKCCILLGTTTTTWSYPQIYLSRVITGYGNTDKWTIGYSISVVTDESSYSKIITVNRTRQIFDDVVAKTFRGRATSVGDGTMIIYPLNDNQVNFGGSSSSNNIYFGYKAADSKAIPTTFIFGGDTGTASLKASGLTSPGVLNLIGTSSIYFRFNNKDDTSLILNATLFKPFDAANNKLTLGSISARWSNVYSNKGNFSGLVNIVGPLKITSTSSAKYILIGNLDSAGTNKPFVIYGANGELYFNNGNSWEGEGGTLSLICKFSQDGVSANKFIGGMLEFNDSVGNTPLIKVGSANKDTIIWKVYSKELGYANQGVFGFDMTYKGTGYGNDNKLVIHADNQDAETKVEAISITLDGVVTLAKTLKGTVTLANRVSCTALTDNKDRPIVLTDTSNGLYYTTKATINYSTGNIITSGSIFAVGGRINTSTNTTPLVIARGNDIRESISIGVEDRIAYFHYQNDEDSNEIRFVLSNADTESGNNVANTSTICFNGNSSGSTVTATKFVGAFSGDLLGNATTAGNADTVDNLHASNFAKFYLSPMTSGAPADSAKIWFINTMPSASGAIVYNVTGVEKTIIAGKSSGAYGHMLQLNYDDTYLRILRYKASTWQSTDWEKISAGYADSADNADTVDGYHSDDFIKSLINPNGKDDYLDYRNRALFKTAYVSGQGDFGSLIIPTWPGNSPNNYYLSELRFQNHDRPQFRYSHNGVVTMDWQTIAFTSDNVASATKLQTARTIWGQSFDGTGNVDGTIKINAKEDIFEAIAIHNDWYTTDSVKYTDIRLLSHPTGKRGGVIRVGTGNYGFFNSMSFGALNQADNYTPYIFINSSGNVGIGTTSPSHKLHVEGAVRATYLKTGSSSYNDGSIELYGSTPFIDFHYGSSTADHTSRLIEGVSGQLTCTGKFRVGLNYTTSTNYLLDVNGVSLFRGDVTLSAGNEDRFLNFYYTGETGYDWRIGYLGSGSGDANYFVILSDKTDGTYVNALRIGLTSLAAVFGGAVTAIHFYESSDIKLKTNIEPILTSDNIPLLKSFNWKANGSHSYGLIALELEELGYSELVSTKDDGYKTVNYSAALSLIVGKLQVKIKELEKEIETLKNKN